MFVFTKIAGRIGTFILLIALTLISLVLTNRFLPQQTLEGSWGRDEERSHDSRSEME